MKNKILILLLFIGSIGNIFSQDTQIIDSISMPYEDQIANIFANIDLSEVTNGNGILYEYGFPLYTLEPFDGTLTDSSKASIDGFSLLYATIYSMAIDDAHRLPHPDVYRNICDTVTKHSHTIPVTLLHQAINRLNPTAIEDSLMTKENNQLFDVANRTSSPYILDEVFMMAPARNKFVGETLRLKINSNLVFNNTQKNIQDIYVDMDDGRGYTKTNLNQTSEATYDSSKTAAVSFKLEYTDGTTYKSHFDMEIEVPTMQTKASTIFPYDTPDLSHHLWSTETYLGDHAGGTIHVAYACGHTSIQKPFIWAEGYNPKVGSIDLSLNYEKAWERLGLEKINDIPLSQYLEEEGYDLIVLDYDKGGDELRRTALFIEEAVRWVNEQKHAAGSIEKNVYIGQSMGGMCGRTALRRMEVNGEDHEVGTYISFDSGHQGVNIPLGASYLFRHIANLGIVGLIPLSSFVQKVEDALDLANLPASRTMPAFQPSGINNLHDSYYDYQNHVLGMPQNCEVLAIANGSKLGNSGTQEFSYGDLILKAKPNTISLLNLLTGWNKYTSSTIAVEKSFMAFTVGFGVSTNIKVWALQSYSIDLERIYKGRINTFVFGIPVLFAYRVAKVKNKPALDSAPGGLIFPHSLSGLPSSLQPDTYKLGGFCFTPTVSTLNHYVSGQFNGFQDAYVDFSNNTDEIANHRVKHVQDYVGNVAQASYHTENNLLIGSFKNTKHTFFTSESARFMLYHLTGGDDLNEVTLSNRTYNYGVGDISGVNSYANLGTKRTKSKITKLETIIGSGKVYINKYEPVAYTDNTNNFHTFGHAGNPTVFSVWLAPDCDDNSPRHLKVKFGGEIVVGQYQHQRGVLHIMPNATLTIQNGGKLKINEYSKIVVHPQGKLVIEDGGSIINDGKIELLDDEIRGDGGILEYHDGATIHMSYDNSEIHFNGGTLLIKDNATFTLNHSATQSGQIRFSGESNTILGEANSKFEITGINNEDVILIMDEASEFYTFNYNLNEDNLLEKFRVTNGKIISNSYSSGYISADLIVTNSKITNPSMQTASIACFDKVKIFSSDFTNINLECNQTYSNGSLLMLNTAVHYNIDNGIAVRVGGKKYTINSCTFDIGDSGYGIYASNLSLPSSINDCEFIGGSKHYISDNSNSLLKVSSSNFTTVQFGEAIIKKGGGLGLKCNAFTGSGIGIIADKFSNLYLSPVPSSYANYGYNSFTNNLRSIYFINSFVPQLNLGYNDFYKTLGGSYFAGEIIMTNSVSIDAQKNAWNGTLTSPPQSDFSIYSINPFATRSVDNSNPASATICGEFDPNISLPSLSGVSQPFLPSIDILGGGLPPIHIDELVALAMSKSEVFSTEPTNNSSNDDAINLFHDIITHNYSSQNADTGQTNTVLNYAFRQMTYTLQDAFNKAQITKQDNQAGFHPLVQLYVNALNTRSTFLIDANNNLELFDHEMQKAHLFSLIGHPQTALSILYNTEYCGLDSLEQATLNELKFHIEETAAMSSHSTARPFADTVYTDMNTYIAPSNREENTAYSFGSVISGIEDIVFQNDCFPSTRKKEVDFTDKHYLKMFPNPADNIINIEYNLFETDEATLKIYGLDGKLLIEKSLSHITPLEEIDISHLSRGAYLYKYLVNGENTQAGKITKM